MADVLVHSNLCRFMQSFIATFPAAHVRPMPGSPARPLEEIIAYHSNVCVVCRHALPAVLNFDQLRIVKAWFVLMPTENN